MAITHPQLDTRIKGADNVWDETQAGVILQNDYFSSESMTVGQIKVWDGSAHVEKPVKVWDGSIWAIKPLKRWDGVAWV